MPLVIAFGIALATTAKLRRQFLVQNSRFYLMRSRPLLGFAFALWSSGCATEYSRDGIGLAGGAEAQMITNDTARISARGNGFTDKARVQDFILLKAAETASARGFTHFAVVSSEDASTESSYTTPSTVQTRVSGNTAYTTYRPGTRNTVVEPGEDAMVKFCKQGKADACSGMLPANEIIQNLGSKYFAKN
ncbi:hypothetical protein OGR47_01795 [Methylocystis sp. MJC1]|uniref:CC0125/CC1285 family lipoprotein n=1 Tax=Methylocystis sp. MJC1 TaxID=2654282 RepID=UPI0013EC9478|nr:hypothetical protein [Methylocystis sp. MJC1]MBU6525744.1 hypothetical protein [Methylocystis sp. MJC1]UZX12213.1 hypothetical protein OGR47_01795 [Methylocystis sp. MJC1]